ncbi:hypothetical protein DWB61_03655 [Ancylomarina euxinus]|uniref:Uncharacterized protein n=1 Tax=Ancylomarina euxinus TaxID=2283627 RepID=A0A425Y716_9BACT|nr:hypothetical protein [Ancylomarina euxinus]MCZ4693905.1 hypothetical protein [Ancylomarina euxinus]MUP14675.1 hypothetical protein [Ancylomarina euxinus]RRG24221.1 hypothetical protein DWB61_03655 [Ancylomarina euxinus]
MKAELNTENIAQAEASFASNINFTLTVLPRIKLIYAIKKELKAYHDLKWSFEFDHVNINQNRIIVEYLPLVKRELALFYEIPLVQKFELRSFLGHSSVHFIDIYNFLLDNDCIKENQFTIHAEYRKIPHFILNLNVKRYQLPVLNHYSSIKQDLINPIDDLVLEELKRNFDLFNPIFKFIIDNFR